MYGIRPSGLLETVRPSRAGVGYPCPGADRRGKVYEGRETKAVTADSRKLTNPEVLGLQAQRGYPKARRQR